MHMFEIDLYLSYDEYSTNNNKRLTIKIITE